MHKLLTNLIAFVLASSVGMQSYDWPTLLRELASKDSSVQIPAQKRMSGTVLPELAKREPAQLKLDILAIMQIGQQDESLRLVSTGVIGALQLGIRDSTNTFKPILPIVFERFHDSNVRVRRNSVSFVANLMPDVPETAIQPFIGSVRDDDFETARAATVGLARLCSHTVAANALSNLFGSEQAKKVRLMVISAAGTGKCVEPHILDLLGKAMEETDRDIVLASIQSASLLGPSAQIFRRQLERAAQSNSDQQISKIATETLSRLRRTEGIR